MRITNKMMSDTFLSDMNSNLEKLNTLEKQRDTGKNFSKPSDDPANVIRSMQLHTGIGVNKQYNKNINTTINWLDVTDTALGQLGDQLGKIEEKLVSAGSPGYGPTERKAIKDELNEVIGNISQILNTSFDGRYIFAGTRVTSKPTDVTKDAKGNTRLVYVNKLGKNPLDNLNIAEQQAMGNLTITKDTTGNIKDIKDESGKLNITLKGKDVTIQGVTSKKEVNMNLEEVMDYTSLKEKLKAETSQGVVMDYNVNVTEIMNFENGGVDSTIPELLQKIINHLDGNNDDGTPGDKDINYKELFNGDLESIQQATNNLLKIRSEVGAKQNRMDAAQKMNKESNFNMTEILSHTEDINLVEKTMEFAVLQSVYISSLQTSAKVLQPTLMDYLR
ncbi:flagellar hook-associated protein 3 [Clostridium niameyense]|uniref:Flagellar hook-associated protein 3 n=1 Tax=Clostridium niameyense TaxID=1622073 RepID=A0A6M0R6U2_9CLOT|nr:flagellar hook-associated protein FlgL [Clostridium niameyense]NEZ45863.1 flagellar hook-associated protein 3 [Clostridium niameyense]